MFGLIRLSADDRRFLDRDGSIDRNRGGFADLMREIRQTWRNAGAGETVPVTSFAMLERIKRYAGQYGPGGWQERYKTWAAQLPDLPDPQQGLFDDLP